MSEFNTETVRVKWGISIGYSTAERHDVWVFGRGELPNDPAARKKLLEEYLETEVSNVLDAWYSVDGDEDV